jgi:hypothetical protein
MHADEKCDEVQSYPGPLQGTTKALKGFLCEVVGVQRKGKLVVKAADGYYHCKSCLTCWHLGCARFALASWQPGADAAARIWGTTTFQCGVCAMELRTK